MSAPKLKVVSNAEGFDLVWELHEKLGDLLEEPGPEPTAGLLNIKTAGEELYAAITGLDFGDYAEEYGGGSNDDDDESEET